MPIKVKRIYLDTIRSRYKNAPKRKKLEILNEFCANCHYSRKYAIRILNGTLTPKLNKPGPRAVYDHQVVHHLVILWKKMNQICSKKMKAAIPLWMDFYKNVDPDTKSLLMTISASTIDRLLAPYRKARGISATRGSLIKTKIPLKLLDSAVTVPGYMEADTVAHCGESLSGEFVNTLTMTDLHSAWTENGAMLNKKAENVLEQMKKIETRMPFMLLGLATDNGSEFINETLEEALTKRLKPVEFVRRRPYKKMTMPTWSKKTSLT